MRSPLAVNRPHTTQQVVNWRKGRGRAAKNAIRRMHEWLKCAVLIDPIAEKRREILQNLDVFQVETTSYEVTAEEKARRAELLRKQKQEREVKEKARKEAQDKAAQEKARKREEDEKKRKAAEEEEHRKWQEHIRKQEEEQKKQKEEEERLKKEKKAQAAQEENEKQEKSKKGKQSKNKKMSESEKSAPVEEPVQVAVKNPEQAAAPEQKQKKHSESESAAVVQDVPLEAASPEESKSSKKNKQNKKVSESEPIAEVQKQTVVESTPVAPVQDDTVTAPVEVQTEKKSKKNKKDKKHSESEHVVEQNTVTKTEAAPVPVEEIPAAEQKADTKPKKNKEPSENEPVQKEETTPAADVEEPCVAIIVQPSNETETATAETTIETHNKKADKKNRNKRNSESKKTNGHLQNTAPASHANQNGSAVHETAAVDATPAPPQNDESLDFLDFVTAKPAKEESPPVLPTPTAPAVVASAAPAQNEDSLDFLDFVTAKPEKEESTAKPVLPPVVKEASPVVQEKSAAPAQDEDSLDFLSFVTAKPEKIESSEKPVLPYVVKETSPVVEEKLDKKSKKNKKNKKHSEGEQMAELKCEGKLEAVPPEEAPAVDVEEAKSDKKFKKNKKDKKHSESEKTVEVKKEAAPEAAPTVVTETVSVDDKKSKKNKKDKKIPECEQCVEAKLEAPMETVSVVETKAEEKSDMKSKKNKKEKKHSESEPAVDIKAETVVEATPVAAKDPSPAPIDKEKSEKTSKKNKKNKKHSESEKIAEISYEASAAPVEQKVESPVEAASVTETPVAAVAEEKSDKKNKKNKKDKKHSESEKVAELTYEASAAPVPVEVAIPVAESEMSKKNKKDKKHSESEHEIKTEVQMQEASAPVIEEKSNKKSKKNKKDKKHAESETAHKEETQHVSQPATTTESATILRATAEESLDFLDFVSPKAEKPAESNTTSTNTTTTEQEEEYVKESENVVSESQSENTTLPAGEVVPQVTETSGAEKPVEQNVLEPVVIQFVEATPSGATEKTTQAEESKTETEPVVTEEPVVSETVEQTTAEPNQEAPVSSDDQSNNVVAENATENVVSGPVDKTVAVKIENVEEAEVNENTESVEPAASKQECAVLGKITESETVPDSYTPEGAQECSAENIESDVSTAEPEAFVVNENISCESETVSANIEELPVPCKAYCVEEPTEHVSHVDSQNEQSIVDTPSVTETVSDENTSVDQVPCVNGETHASEGPKSSEEPAEDMTVSENVEQNESNEIDVSHKNVAENQTVEETPIESNHVDVVKSVSEESVEQQPLAITEESSNIERVTPTIDSSVAESQDSFDDSVQSFVCVDAPACEISENETSVENVDKTELPSKVYQKTPAASESNNGMSDATTDVVSKNVESEAEANENATTTSANDSVNQGSLNVVSGAAESEPVQNDSAGSQIVFNVSVTESFDEPDQDEQENNVVHKDHISESVEEKTEIAPSNIVEDSVTEGLTATDLSSEQETHDDHRKTEKVEETADGCTFIQVPSADVETGSCVPIVLESAEVILSEEVPAAESTEHVPAAGNSVASVQTQDTSTNKVEESLELSESPSELRNVEERNTVPTEAEIEGQQPLDVIEQTVDVDSSVIIASEHPSGTIEKHEEHLTLPMSEKEQLYFNSGYASENVVETQTASAVGSIVEISTNEVSSAVSDAEEHHKIGQTELDSSANEDNVDPTPEISHSDKTASVPGDQSGVTNTETENPQREAVLESHPESILNKSTNQESVQKSADILKADPNAVVNDTNNATANTDNEQPREVIIGSTDSRSFPEFTSDSVRQDDAPIDNGSAGTSQEPPSISKKRLLDIQVTQDEQEASSLLNNNEVVVEAFAEMNLDKSDKKPVENLQQMALPQKSPKGPSHEYVLKDAVSTETLTDELSNSVDPIETVLVKGEAKSQKDVTESTEEETFVDAQETLDQQCSDHMELVHTSVEETAEPVFENNVASIDVNSEYVTETNQMTSAAEQNDRSSENQEPVCDSVQEEQGSREFESVQPADIVEGSSENYKTVENATAAENERTDSWEFDEKSACSMSVPNVSENDCNIDNDCQRETREYQTEIESLTAEPSVNEIESEKAPSTDRKAEEVPVVESLNDVAVVKRCEIAATRLDAQTEEEHARHHSDNTQPTIEQPSKEERVTESVEKAAVPEIEPVSTEEHSAHDTPNTKHEDPIVQSSYETVNEVLSNEQMINRTFEQNKNQSVEFAIDENVCEPVESNRKSTSPVSCKPVFLSAVTMKVIRKSEQQISQNIEGSVEKQIENESSTENEGGPASKEESESRTMSNVEQVGSSVSGYKTFIAENCEKTTAENNHQSEMNEESATSTETNKGVEVRRSSESHSEFVISDQGSETVAQEHETVVTVVVTEAPPSAEAPAETAIAPKSTSTTVLNDQNPVQESFTKMHTDVVNAVPKDDHVQKEEADSTGGKSKNKKNKKNRNSKSITEQTEVSITDLDKSADAEIAALNKESISPPIQVNEISSTEHTESRHNETIETIISQHVVDQKDVSPTRFAQNVQALVERTLKQTHPGAEIDPNVKMQIDIQLQRLAARRPVVEARNVITPLPLQLHISRPTTPVNRERMYKLLPKDIIFCSSLIEAHGEDYNAMAANPLNIYRENARGLQRKIRIFKESPHFQTYLKAKEEGITVEAMLAAEAAH